MKLEKFLKNICNHKYGTGSTFYIKDAGAIDTLNYIEYRYDALADIHSLYQIELNGAGEIMYKGELPASLLINPGTKFIEKEIMKPQYAVMKSDM